MLRSNNGLLKTRGTSLSTLHLKDFCILKHCCIRSAVTQSNRSNDMQCCKRRSKKKKTTRPYARRQLPINLMTAWTSWHNCNQVLWLPPQSTRGWKGNWRHFFGYFGINLVCSSTLTRACFTLQAMVHHKNHQAAPRLLLQNVTMIFLYNLLNKLHLQNTFFLICLKMFRTSTESEANSLSLWILCLHSFLLLNDFKDSF